MATEDSVRRQKNIVGIVAIALLLVFTVLAFTGYLDFLSWLIADVVVAVIANLILRSITRRNL